ncbi:hypothetical protein N806_11050 [Rhodococcus sp. P27]|nr:hypothetical protein N806_11050 [Rhodococcus sp. P27]
MAPVPEASVAITDFIARRNHDLVQAYRGLYDRRSAGPTLLGVAPGSYVLFDLAGKSAAGLGPRVRLTVTPPHCPLNHRMQVIQIQIRRDEDSSPDLSGNIVDTDTYRVLRRYRAPLRTQRSRNLNAPTPSASF